MKYLHSFKYSLAKVFFNHGLKRTFTLFVVIATLLPILIGGITSFVISQQTIQGVVSDFNKSWIAKQKDYLELLLQDVDSLVESIANVEGIKNVFEKETNSDTNNDYTSLTTQSTIGYILSGYNLKGLVSIDLFSLNGLHFHVGDTLNIKNVDNPTKDRLYQTALNSSASVVWEGFESNINENSAQEKVITAVKIIKKFDASTYKEVPIGFLVINYDINSFYEHFSNGNFNQNSILMIVDSNRNVLFHPDKTIIGSKIDKSLSSLLTGENGAITETIGGQEMFVVYSNSIKYGWTVLSHIPIEVLTEKTKPIINYTFGAAFVCLLLILIYAINLSKKTLHPINNMTKLFQDIGNNTADLSMRLAVKSDNEIGELVKWFNTFMESMAEKKVVEDKLRIANEELEIRVRDRTIALEELNTLLSEDISKRKAVEEMLAKRTTEIEEALAKLKATQNQLIQREKLAGIGQLAAGIAHEINNPLGFVVSNISSLEKYVDIFSDLLKLYRNFRIQISSSQNETITTILNEIIAFEAEKSLDYMLEDLDELFLDVNKGLERVSKIVKSLRAFSWMDRDIAYEIYDLNRGIENSLLIAQNEIKYFATVEQQLSDIPEINVIGSEINQVLLNMIVNAVHAIKMKGTDSLGIIRISTTNDENFVYCLIEDDGVGISTENLKNIFNPFFTTKSVGEGTGLGLNISYDIIVNEHHGEIIVESKVGTGTKFTIKLPIKQIADTVK